MPQPISYILCVCVHKVNIKTDFDGILLNNEKQQTIEIQTTWINLKRIILSRKKSIPKVIYSYDSIYTLRKWKKYENKEQVTHCQSRIRVDRWEVR
jgi:hypothetical protein